MLKKIKSEFINFIVKPTLRYMNRSVFWVFLNTIFARIIIFLRKRTIKKYKKKYNVKEIWMWHFHIDYLDINLWIKLFEAFVYKYKIYKTKIWYVVADLHLWMWKYKKRELKQIINLLKTSEKIYILWDLTEWIVPIWNFNKIEKKLLKLIKKGINNKNVFYIRWNHDNCYLSKYWNNFIILDDILLIHWDFLTNSFRPFCWLFDKIKKIKKTTK